MSVPGLVPASATRWLSAPRRTLAKASRVGRRLSQVSLLAWDCAAHGVRIDVTGQLQDFARFVRSRLQTARHTPESRPTLVRAA